MYITPEVKLPTTKLLTTVKLNVSSKVPVVVDWINKYCVVPGFTVQVKITEVLSFRLPVKSVTTIHEERMNY